ncbi:MAG: protein kinase, partial [Chloroflexi bacterium]|nr:protein kinase [Chloroflexota bacterium]
MKASEKDIKEIFAKAIALEDATERDVFLEEACGTDSTLRQEVDKLLKAYIQAGDFLEEPAGLGDVTLESSPLTEGPGTLIGPYKLLEKIGEGGMAVVYMAEQERPLRRRAALKIIKLGMDTKQVIARFDAERQVLAMMDHPNIAKVLDAGTTKTGRPYFVMELVRGESITKYCDKNKLSTQARLELFVPVCNAVHHAHQKGIIHRDLKPSNIMVTMHDGKPVPMVIDFGIAKATNQRLTEQTIFTRYAEMIGTPEYMSPEQAEMSGLDIDTRTDIYSLGIVLYELLTGALPFDSKTLRAAAIGEIQRIIREEEPVRPSTRLSGLGKEAEDIAARRQTNVAGLAKRLHRELEWIPLKAMRKDRTRRYRSASEFADDVQNYLQDQPLIAGPESVTYRLGKQAKKYRLALLAVAAIAMVVIVGFMVSTSMYIKAHRALNTVEQLESQMYTDQQLSAILTLHAEGRYQKAIDELQTNFSTEEMSSKLHLLQGQLLYNMGRIEEAEKELHPLTKEKPEIAGAAHYLLARIYTQSDPERAREHHLEAESLLPQTAEAYTLRAMASSTPQATVQWLSKALELNASHYPARQARALAYYGLKEFAAMERDAEAMVVMRTQHSLGYALRAIARREQGRYDPALDDHRKAIALSANQKNIAELYHQRRKTH